jgi:PAS domain S-box-containing protein
MATEHTRTEAVPEQQAAADVADHGKSWPSREQWFQYGFDHMPCGMVVTSLTSGRPNLYLAANDTFCRLAGFTWGELAGREFLSDFHPEEQPVLEAALQRVMSGDGQGIRTISRSPATGRR